MNNRKFESNSYTLVENTRRPRSNSDVLRLDGFKVRLSIDRNRCLCIEAEQLEASKFYLAKLKKENVIKLGTGGLLESVEELNDLIEYAIQNNDPKVTIRMTEDAELIIYQNIRIGARDKELQFMIELSENRLGPLEVCEKYLDEIQKEGQEELSPVKIGFVSVFNKLIDNSHQMEEKLQDTLNRIKALEIKSGITSR